MEFFVKHFNELTAGEIYEILKSRDEIFALEQQLNYVDEDDIDYESYHCFFTESGRVTAYLRAYYFNEEEGVVKFGRVLSLEHNKGLGSKLIFESIDAIKEKMHCEKIFINAQKHAQGFYEKLGFEVTSEEYLEEGIPHIDMQLRL